MRTFKTQGMAAAGRPQGWAAGAPQLGHKRSGFGRCMKHKHA